MDEEFQQTFEGFQRINPASDEANQQVPETEILEVPFYPEDRDDLATDEIEEEVEALVRATQQRLEAQEISSNGPIGYVSNARNAASQSDTFSFWAGAEEVSLGIGSLVQHSVEDVIDSGNILNTYGIVTETSGLTLGLDDFAIHTYETDGQPPLKSIQPSVSRRRPIVNYKASVLSSNQRFQRPVLSGPVYSVKADELAAIHAQSQASWPGANYMLLGFYEDGNGDFGILAEERTRVLGPKQGHVILSGQPGAGKTSLYLTMVIALYAQLQNLQREKGDEFEIQEHKIPRVATLAFNVKGADLLFLDHLYDQELSEADRKMWTAAKVDSQKSPFGRVIVYVPLADDGLNRNSLRNNPAANVTGYSETRPFALGIQTLWPYLNLFFDNKSTATMNLLAEIEQYFEETNGDQGFSLADVLHLFDSQIRLSQTDRHNTRWEGFNLSTIRAVYQRFRTLPATLEGLIDEKGRGFGLEMNDLQPYDMVVVDLERIMANPRDPQVAENSIKIITAYVLNCLTEVMTRGDAKVDHVIVFADELNRLAPRHGSSGIGDYLAQIARTTRDRGIVLFGAGQFRSGVNEDILKAASVHYSMQTPDYELKDHLYSTLTDEFKVRLTRLKPGETLLQYPSLRTAVFARFPRPFVLTGGIEWRRKFPQGDPLPVADCVAERLRHLDTESPLQLDEVRQLLNGLPDGSNKREQIVDILREVERSYVVPDHKGSEKPWEQFSKLVKLQLGQTSSAGTSRRPIITPSGYANASEGWDNDE